MKKIRRKCATVAPYLAESKRECSFAITVRYKPDWKDTSSEHVLDHISRRWHTPVLYCSRDVNDNIATIKTL
jgi:DNA-binding HxlR family transcriptional regulator